MGRHASNDVLEVSMEEIAGIRQAISETDLPDRYKAILLTLIEEVVNIKQTANERKAALERLKRMFGSNSEKRSPANEISETSNQAEENETDHSKVAEPVKKAKNHGRNGAKDYCISKTVAYHHQLLHPGDCCPKCQHGTLQSCEPRKIIRLIGNAPISAELHQPDRLRCGGCGLTFTAETPAEILDSKFDPSANAIVACLRFSMGMPHFRLAKLQNSLGVPLPASTQYEMVELLWTVVVPVFNELLRLAAGWPLLFVDDTPAKILELLKDKEKRKDAGERVGIFTTAMVARREGKEIHLFFTGGKHAGENLGLLLDKRDESLEPAMQMSDALSRNFPKNHLTVVTLCLVHARRNFIDCEEAYPDDAMYVISRIALIYKNEKLIKQQEMSDVQRLEYHQKHSRAPMEEIKEFALARLENKDIEKNSPLNQAYRYMIDHWKALTMFLEVPGAPLDNNPAERLIKTAIPHRKNSLFYKTESGAAVGDCLMSLCQTCVANGENPFEFFIALQKNSKHVARNPHLWLPWNYRNTLKSVGSSP
jgi:transposase